MKRRLIFLFLLGSLVFARAYVFFDSEQGWTTISESMAIVCKPKVIATVSNIMRMTLLNRLVFEQLPANGLIKDANLE